MYSKTPSGVLLFFLLFLLGYALPLSAQDEGRRGPKSSIFYIRTDTTPPPKLVLQRSLVIPGWGQHTNRQWWKIPIVYAALGGITYMGVNNHLQYRDYRAAYYNAVNTDSDQRFGPTPDRLLNVSPRQLQVNRNAFRNARDMSFVYLLLAYGLNALDAYIYAHLRDFEVTDDLSLNFNYIPESQSVGLTLTIQF